jgi:hypothetical protein
MNEQLPTIGWIGGLSRLDHRMQEEAKKVGCHLEFHDGNVQGHRSKSLRKIVRRSQALVIAVELISHQGALTARAEARQAGIPVVFVKKASHAALASAVESIKQQLTPPAPRRLSEQAPRRPPASCRRPAAPRYARARGDHGAPGGGRFWPRRSLLAAPFDPRHRLVGQACAPGRALRAGRGARALLLRRRGRGRGPLRPGALGGPLGRGPLAARRARAVRPTPGRPLVPRAQPGPDRGPGGPASSSATASAARPTRSPGSARSRPSTPGASGSPPPCPGRPSAPAASAAASSTCAPSSVTPRTFYTATRPPADLAPDFHALVSLAP